MGNWRNRPPRRPYNHHRNYYYDSELSYEDLQDNVPPWEKKFCYAVGSVPWHKVVNTKYIMSHHSNVVNWDDSAVKDTFITAKRRFWEEMNGLDCDTSAPPDPDLYIDEIDWDPKIDPDLMKELDRDFFAPADEEAEVKNKLMRKYKRIRWSSGCGSLANPFGEVSPWECSESNKATHVGGVSVNNGSESVDIGQSSLQVKTSLGGNEVGIPRDFNNTTQVSGISVNNASKSVEIGLSAREVEASPANKIVENKNPWESSNNVSKNTGNGQSAWIVKDNAQWNEPNSHDRDDCIDRNPCEQSKGGVVGPGKVNGWGGSCDKGWGWNQDEWNFDHTWAQSSSQHYNYNNYNKNNRGWRDYGRDSRRGQFGLCNNNNNNNQNKGFDFGRRSNHHYGQAYYNSSNNYNNNSSGYGRNESGYRNSRFFRGHENRTSGDCWENRANNKRRISFE